MKIKQLLIDENGVPSYLDMISTAPINFRALGFIAWNANKFPRSCHRLDPSNHGSRFSNSGYQATKRKKPLRLDLYSKQI